MNFVQLVRRHIARRRVQQRRYPVDYRSAGVLDCGGLYNVVFHIWLSLYPPIAHVAVARSVNLAYGFLLDYYALISLDCHNGRHPYTASRFDFLAKRLAVKIFVYRVRHVFLFYGFDCQTELVADCLRRIPCVRRHDLFGMCKLLFKLLFGKVAAVSFGKRQTVIFYVVAVCALDFGDFVAAARATMFIQKISCIPLPVTVQLYSFASLSSLFVNDAAVVQG